METQKKSQSKLFKFDGISLVLLIAESSVFIYSKKKTSHCIEMRKARD